MKFNKRFAPKNKIHHQSYLQPSQPNHIQCNTIQNQNHHHFKNANSLDRKQNPLNNLNRNLQYLRSKEHIFTEAFDATQNGEDAQNKQPQQTARKIKLQNLRDSIQSLQKIISRSRQVLNDSSFLNYSHERSISPKTTIKSDSLEVKFNFSTRKVNQRKLENKKIQFLASDLNSTDPNQVLRESLLLDSIQKAHDQKKAQLYQQLSINIQSPNNKSKEVKNKNTYLGTETELKTGNQLNSTLQKLLNQSFESTMNGRTKTVNSLTTTMVSQSPKWFKKDDFKLLNKIKQHNRINFFKKSSHFGHQLQETNNFTTKEVSFDDIHFNQTAGDQFQVQEEPIQSEQQKILIDQFEDDIIEDENVSVVKQIQNLTAKSRNSYQGHSVPQQSYSRTYENLFKQKMQNLSKQKLQHSKKVLLKTPKAYKNYEQNRSVKKDFKLKDWIPKNFTEFQNRILQRKDAQNVFRQKSNQGKFSPRLIACGKQNRNSQASQSKERRNGFQERERKKKFINEVWKYPFVERYLKQSDIVSIYDKLRKSKIPQQKWILFVIDQVHKKMKHLHS